MDIHVTPTGEVVATKAATLDFLTSMEPREITIDVEVVRSDGTREPIETIKGELHELPGNTP